MKLKLEIELEYDAETMHGSDPESIAEFRDSVLLNPADAEGLTLHSNCIGDEIGPCSVTRIISDWPNVKGHAPTGAPINNKNTMSCPEGSRKKSVDDDRASSPLVMYVVESKRADLGGEWKQVGNAYTTLKRAEKEAKWERLSRKGKESRIVCIYANETSAVTDTSGKTL